MGWVRMSPIMTQLRSSPHIQFPSRNGVLWAWLYYFECLIQSTYSYAMNNLTTRAPGPGHASGVSRLGLADVQQCPAWRATVMPQDGSMDWTHFVCVHWESSAAILTLAFLWTFKSKLKSHKTTLINLIHIIYHHRIVNRYDLLDKAIVEGHMDSPRQQSSVQWR